MHFRVGAFLYASFALLWLFQLEGAQGRPLYVLVAALFFVASVWRSSSLVPLAVTVSLLSLACRHYVDAAALMGLSLLLGGLPASHPSAMAGVCGAVAIMMSLGLIVQRLRPTPWGWQVELGLLGGTAAALGGALLARRVGWQSVARGSWVAAALLGGLSLMIPEKPVGQTSCFDVPHDLGEKLEIYAADNQGYYPDRMDVAAPDYLRCPVSPRGYRYEVSPEHTAFTLECRGPHFTELGSSKLNSGWSYQSDVGSTVLP